MSVTYISTDNVDPKTGELCERIIKLVHEYDGEISLSQAIGAIELSKFDIINEATRG